ncbi:hypothetical protein EPA93_02845 [Ktedonosporobacter rubrisoli]|uniref:Endonuclease/exonuclease/phosphatase domain-containing protein n=1 Tax=Ktedonosporobacter rubrisoli TaxID=2509675 RepID=A0A4P6JK31_KTERU|nr:endonuclease/exonuclease/phosphatase family protein [Ktedonosporobacter rubrisoli]QBD74986.1 hypothetical protein EPA93_02845 [Ktedonosporobacter rubrisoli]
MPLRVLSYNILNGGEDRLPHLAHIIRQQRPNVVALIEANSRPHAEALASQLKMQLVFGEANGKANVALLSERPIIHYANHRLPDLAKTLLEITIHWEGAPLTIFATHLKAGQTKKSEQKRSIEIQVILALMQQLGGRPHLLMGDLNTVSPEDPIDLPEYLATLRERGESSPDPQFPRQVTPLLLQAGYTDCYRSQHHIAPGYTTHTMHPALRIDYIFATSSLARRLAACDIVTGVETCTASDHFPIWAEFR